MASLESPSSAEELYRYRGSDVPLTRPIFQGDIFAGVHIPGIEDGAGLAMVITHACSMRQGHSLRARLIVARVELRTPPIPLPWSGNFRFMPLPDLTPGEPGSWATNFEALGTIRSEILLMAERIACLDDRGVLLLQQRHAHHLTRYVVETEALYEQCASVLGEAELLEEWLTASLEDLEDGCSGRVAEEAAEFDAFVGPFRDDLNDPSRRASVRRTVNQEIRRRFR